MALSRHLENHCEERTKLKEKVLNTKSPRLQENLQKAYSEKDKEVKRSARKDKRAYIDKLADDAEKAASKGNLNTVYKITKELCGKSTQIPPVKDTNGKVITTEREQAERWLQHFKRSLIDQNQTQCLKEYSNKTTSI